MNRAFKINYNCKSNWWIKLLYFLVCKFCNTVCTNILFFLNKVQSVHIWFMVDAKLRGITPSYMWYSFILLTAGSTWIGSRAFHGFVLPHKKKICPFHLEKGLLSKMLVFCLIGLLLKNPLSAITLSLGSNRSAIPDNAVIALSLMLPVYKELKNETAPHGVILIKILNVVRLLWLE